MLTLKSFVWEKFPVGVTTTLVNAAVPQLVATIGIAFEVELTGALPKLTFVTLRHTAGATDVPVPVKVDVIGVTEELFARLRLAGPRAPTPAGLKDTGIRQACPAGNGLGQLFAVRMKSPELVPVIETVQVIGPVPVFAHVKLNGEL